MLPILLAVGLAVSGWICPLASKILLGIAGLWVVALLLSYIFPDVPWLCISIKKSKSIWGLWHTGGTIGKKKQLLTKCDMTRRIILMEPNTDNLQLIEAARESSASVVEAVKEIRMITRDIYKQKELHRKIDVKYISERPDESFTFFDYINMGVESYAEFSNEAYVIVSTPRDVPAHMRKNRMYKNYGDEQIEFKHFAKMYEQAWANARPPHADEIKEAKAVDKAGNRIKHQLGVTKRKFHALLIRASQPIKKSGKGKS